MQATHTRDGRLLLHRVPETNGPVSCVMQADRYLKCPGLHGHGHEQHSEPRGSAEMPRANAPIPLRSMSYSTMHYPGDVGIGHPGHLLALLSWGALPSFSPGGSQSPAPIVPRPLLLAGFRLLPWLLSHDRQALDGLALARLSSLTSCQLSPHFSASRQLPRGQASNMPPWGVTFACQALSPGLFPLFLLPSNGSFTSVPQDCVSPG